MLKTLLFFEAEWVFKHFFSTTLNGENTGVKHAFSYKKIEMVVKNNIFNKRSLVSVLRTLTV